MRRVLIYATIYGAIGAMVGVCVALYTKDVPLPKNIVLQNGSATKATSVHASSSTPSANATVAEPPTTSMEEVTDVAES
jgi:hypothetical protein